MPDESLFFSFKHRFPCFNNGHLIQRKIIIITLRKSLEARLKRDGPMDKVEIKIIELKVRECLFQCRNYIFRLMCCVPKFGCNPYILSLNIKFRETLLQGSPNFLFIPVHSCAVDVAIAYVQSGLNCVAYFTGNRFPGTQTDRVYFVTIFKC